MQINTTSAAGFRELNGGPSEFQQLHLEHNRCLCQLKRHQRPRPSSIILWPLRAEGRYVGSAPAGRPARETNTEAACVGFSSLRQPGFHSNGHRRQPGKTS